jgi:hypothetical protein
MGRILIALIAFQSWRERIEKFFDALERISAETGLSQDYSFEEASGNLG